MDVGATIAGKYRLVRELGKGGMGSVFEAVHVSTAKRVAVKLMRAGGDSSNEDSKARVIRFQREALAAGRLETQHVVQVYDAGVDESTGAPYLVMEHLDGEDLSQLIRRIGPLHPAVAAAVIAQACFGLQKAHEAGVVHRDIKPSNLFLARNEHGTLTVKVLDFGIAKVTRGEGDINDVGATITETGALVGSPHYMSPEQAKSLKSIDYRTDLWSLGVVLHKCLSGRTPFDEHTTLGQVIIAVCSEDAVSVQEHAPWVPAEIAALVRSALRRDPNARVQSAAELLDALYAHLPPTGVVLTPDLFVPLPDEVRSMVADRSHESEHPTRTPPNLRKAPDIPVDIDGIPVTPSSARRLNVRGAAGEVTATHDSFVTTSAGEGGRKKRRGALFIGAGTVVVLLAALGVSRWIADPRPKATPDTVAGSAALPSAAPTEAPAGSVAPSVTAIPRSVVVKVGPPGVAVEVDGSARTVTEGAIVVEGAIGSVHRVRVSLDGRFATKDVVLTDQGPRPDTVLLAAEPATVTKPIVTGHTTAAAAPKASASAAATTAPTKSAAGFDQRFE